MILYALILSLAVLGLAGWLHGRGVVSENTVVVLVLMAVGGFVIVALKNRWKRVRWGGGEIELKNKMVLI